MQPMATRYSLVVPVYRNEETIPALLEALAGIESQRRVRWSLDVDPVDLF